ncbi:MAG TPA: DMT family transporter [Pseudomonadales bacterium]
MPVIASYILVVMIWATTPMAIKLSSLGMSAQAAILLRMLLATVLMSLVVAVWRHAACLKRRHLPVYLAASIALFPNMALVYQASGWISSGMIAVMFALTPIVSGILAALLLREKRLGLRAVLAIAMALAGLLLVFVDQLALSATALKGIGLMLCSVLLFSISQVAVKYLQRELIVDASEQTLGALLLSLPGLLASWLWFDGSLPLQAPAASLYAIAYLAVVGSVLGFVAYYFILSKLSVALVSLIPMITPVLALWLGVLVLHEQVSPQLQAGSALIVLALLVYQQWRLPRLAGWGWKVGSRQ